MTIDGQPPEPKPKQALYFVRLGLVVYGTSIVDADKKIGTLIEMLMGSKSVNDAWRLEAPYQYLGT